MVDRVEIIMDGKEVTEDTIITVQNLGNNVVLHTDEADIDLQDALDGIYSVQVNITKVPLFESKANSLAERYAELSKAYDELMKNYIALCQSIMNKNKN